METLKYKVGWKSFFGVKVAYLLLLSSFIIFIVFSHSFVCLWYKTSVLALSISYFWLLLLILIIKFILNILHIDFHQSIQSFWIISSIHIARRYIRARSFTNTPSREVYKPKSLVQNLASRQGRCLLIYIFAKLEAAAYSFIFSLGLGYRPLLRPKPPDTTNWCLVQT